MLIISTVLNYVFVADFEEIDFDDRIYLQEIKRNEKLIQKLNLIQNRAAGDKDLLVQNQSIISYSDTLCNYNISRQETKYIQVARNNPELY